MAPRGLAPAVLLLLSSSIDAQEKTQLALEKLNEHKTMVAMGVVAAAGVGAAGAGAGAYSNSYSTSGTGTNGSDNS